jgi:hypothetical protein
MPIKRGIVEKPLHIRAEWRYLEALAARIYAMIGKKARSKHRWVELSALFFVPSPATAFRGGRRSCSVCQFSGLIAKTSANQHESSAFAAQIL